MHAGTDHDQVRIALRGKANNLFVGSAFDDVCLGPGAVAASQLGHAFLYVTSQTRERVQTTFRKHDGNLFQVIPDYVNDVQLRSGLIRELCGNLRGRS